MKFSLKSSIVGGIGAILATTGAVHADALYQLTTTDSGNSLGLANGTTIGNEIFLNSPSASLDSFSFEIYSPNHTFSGAVQMDVSLYYMSASDGTGVPTTTFFHSTPFALDTPYNTTPGNTLVGTLIFDSANYTFPITLPYDFMLAVTVTGLDTFNGDQLGLEVFTGPPTAGNVYDDYWYDNGVDGWQDLTLGPGNNNFGAEFTGTPTPEPSAIYLGAMGAALLAGLTWLRRRQNPAKQS